MRNEGGIKCCFSLCVGPCGAVNQLCCCHLAWVCLLQGPESMWYDLQVPCTSHTGLHAVALLGLVSPGFTLAMVPGPVSLCHLRVLPHSQPLHPGSRPALLTCCVHKHLSGFAFCVKCLGNLVWKVLKKCRFDLIWFDLQSEKWKSFCKAKTPVQLFQLASAACKAACIRFWITGDFLDTFTLLFSMTPYPASFWHFLPFSLFYLLTLPAPQVLNITKPSRVEASHKSIDDYIFPIMIYDRHLLL